MSRLKHFLVGVDGSEGSRRALEYALWLAQQCGADVTVLEVVEDAGPLPTVDEAPPQGLTRTQWLAVERLRPLRPVLQDTAVPWVPRVEEGDPADVICRVAEEAHVDLVVVGSRGLSTIRRFLIGSVSDRVVHHAPCSVMIIKDNGAHSRVSLPSSI